MIPPVLSALRRTAGIATRRPHAALWTLLALSCALFLIGLAVVVAATVDRWAANQSGGGGNMVVYLGEAVEPARASALVSELRGLRGVERADLVPATESANRLTRALGSDPALLEGVDIATLPASVEVKLAPGVRDVVAMSPTLRALRGSPGVTDVVVEDGADDQITSAVPAVRAIAWTGAALFTGLALVIVLAAVRVRLDRSEREAAVLHLLGAPPGFVAIPSALAGALHGVVAALVAAVALGIVLHGRGSAIELVSPPLVAFAALVALGGVVGLVGGGLAGVARAR